MDAERAFVVRELAPPEAGAVAGRLRALFRDAVLATAPACFDAARVAVWAGGADDAARWEPRLRDGATWVAASATTDAIVGFGVVRPAAYVDLLYVDPAHHRRGVASALLAAIEAAARHAGVAALTVHASPISRPLFAKSGYAVVALEEVEHGGLVFPRTAMRKALR